MKKIIAIAAVCILIVVSGYNIFEYINHYGVKVQYSTEQTTEEKPSRRHERGKLGIAVLITAEFVFFCFYCVRTVMYWLNYICFDQDYGIGVEMVGRFFCMVNGILVFVFLVFCVYSVLS
jgi:hypothetical protein